MQEGYLQLQVYPYANNNSPMQQPTQQAYINYQHKIDNSNYQHDNYPANFFIPNQTALTRSNSHPYYQQNPQQLIFPMTQPFRSSNIDRKLTLIEYQEPDDFTQVQTKSQQKVQASMRQSFEQSAENTSSTGLNICCIVLLVLGLFGIIFSVYYLASRNYLQTQTSNQIPSLSASSSSNYNNLNLSHQSNLHWIAFRKFQ